MHVLGTAGHVDHGKSTLVRALTGIDPDRLAEEKARQMTIDLGFAWMTLDGQEVGIVDVPGHRDFIENMLAGVGGIDVAILVIAADEGVMPQTREHLAILDLLEISGGVVALTKIDLVDDPEWMELVTLDIVDVLGGTVMQEAPIVPVSAANGNGVDSLKQQLLEQLKETLPKRNLGRPRLPVDRVFTLSGFGTVVTGTLIDGRFRTGDQVVVEPAGHAARVRGLQTHKIKRNVAEPGSRVAINLSGIERNQVQRGDVIAAPGAVGRTTLFDAQYRQLADAQSPLKHNMPVKLFAGAAEVVARTRLIGAKRIPPGEEGWIQLALSEPVAVLRGDRFILRRPSPAATLGGGRVLDPLPGRQHRRFRADVVDHFETMSAGTPAELLLATLQRQEPLSAGELQQSVGLGNGPSAEALAELQESGLVLTFGNYLISRAGWENYENRLLEALAAYHEQFPLRLGMPREEARSRTRAEPALFNSLLEQMLSRAEIKEVRGRMALPHHEVQFDEQQEAKIQRLFERLSASGINSPSPKSCRDEVGEAVYFALVDLGRLHPLNNDVVYGTAEYERLKATIIDYLQEHKRINAGQVRDLLDTSRKYAIALLEHLDDLRLTRRVDDYRVLR